MRVWVRFGGRSVTQTRRSVDGYRIDDIVFHARINDGELLTGQGPGLNPDFVLETDTATFVAVISGELSLQDAVESNRLHVDGSIDALQQSAERFDVSRLQENAT